jgi:hypothetical protein
MKSFRGHITEVFDTTHSWEPVSTGGNHWVYRFALAKVRRGLFLPAPLRGEEIVKFYEKQGMRITGKDGQNRPLVNGKDIASTPLAGAMYEVGFRSLGHNMEKYSELFKRSNLGGNDKYLLWEIDFARNDSMLKWSNGNWQWDYESNSGGSDEDLGIMGGGDAAAILSTVVAIAKEFVAKVKPMGILLGTKMDAKGARSRIYAGLASRNNARMIPIPYSPRSGMGNANMLWIGKDKDFQPVSKEGKP